MIGHLRDKTTAEKTVVVITEKRKLRKEKTARIHLRKLDTAVTTKMYKSGRMGVWHCQYTIILDLTFESSCHDIKAFYRVTFVTLCSWAE